MAITVPIGVPLFFIAAAAIGYLGAVADVLARTRSSRSSLAGILHFVWGRYCNYRAMRAIGTNLAAPVQQINLIVTLVARDLVPGRDADAAADPGDRADPARAGFTMREGRGKSQLRRQRRDREPPVESAAPAPPSREQRAFRPHYAEGYIFALLSATGYGLSPILIRLGTRGPRARRQHRRRPHLLCGGDGGDGASCCCGRGGCAMRSAVKPEVGEVVHALRRHGLRLADVHLHGAVRSRR